jgi:hypothetical protein
VNHAPQPLSGGPLSRLPDRASDRASAWAPDWASAWAAVRPTAEVEEVAELARGWAAVRITAEVEEGGLVAVEASRATLWRMPRQTKQCGATAAAQTISLEKGILLASDGGRYGCAIYWEVGWGGLLCLYPANHAAPNERISPGNVLFYLRCKDTVVVGPNTVDWWFIYEELPRSAPERALSQRPGSAAGGVGVTNLPPEGRADGAPNP